MFSKLIHAFGVLIITVATIQPAEAARNHHKHLTHAGLAKIVKDTRLPPCTACSRCHGTNERSVCAIANNDKYRKLQGLASWYGGRFHGRKTASGERFNKNALTAAHKTLPLGTRVHVRNLDNGRSVIVTINDRGPFVRSRIIDLSQAAARAISMAGTERVELTILARG